MILFLHIEKSAGTSLAYYLKSKFGKKFIDLFPVENGKYITNKDINSAIKYHRPEVLSSHKLFLDKINLELFDKVIITMRDPYSRFVSHYNHLLELGRVNCLSFSDAIKHQEFKNLQYSKCGGEKAKLIMEKLYNSNKLIIFNTTTFREDFDFFVGENFSSPKKNIRKDKLIDDNTIKNHEKIFKEENNLEYNFYENIELFQKPKRLEKTLKLENLESKKQNVDISNNYRKYFSMPILILKKCLTSFKFLKTKNMSGYYVCTKKN